MLLSRKSDPQGWGEGMDLRWVLLHLINETARHAGHADATTRVARRNYRRVIERHSDRRE